MKWGPGLFGELNDRVIPGAGVVSLQMKKLRSFRVPMYPIRSAVRAQFSFGNGVVGLLLTYQPLAVPSDRFGQSLGLSAYMNCITDHSPRTLPPILLRASMMVTS